MQDANWNTTALVTTGGSVVERNAYDAFGAASVLDAGFAAKAGGTGYGWRVLFQGMAYDVAAGLSQQRARWYSPTLGRWASEDLMLYDGGDVNLYRFGYDNPANYNDPAGLQPPPAWWMRGRAKCEGDSAPVPTLGGDTIKKEPPDKTENKTIPQAKKYEQPLNKIVIDKTWSAADIEGLYRRITAGCPDADKSFSVFSSFLYQARQVKVPILGPDEQDSIRFFDVCVRWTDSVTAIYLGEIGLKRAKLAGKAYFRIGTGSEGTNRQFWLNSNNDIEHAAVKVTITGCKGESFSFYLDDALGGGIGNRDHIFGLTDVAPFRKPFVIQGSNKVFKPAE